MTNLGYSSILEQTRCEMFGRVLNCMVLLQAYGKTFFRRVAEGILSDRIVTSPISDVAVIKFSPSTGSVSSEM